MASTTSEAALRAAMECRFGHAGAAAADEVDGRRRSASNAKAMGLTAGVMERARQELVHFEISGQRALVLLGVARPCRRPMGRI